MSSRKNFRRTVLLGTSLLLVGISCSRQQIPETGVTRVIGPDGVTEVVSHAPEPLPAPWRFERDLVIGVEYGDEEDMLRNPAAFAVLEDGTHVILDASPSQIRIYDAEGQNVSEFGQPGDGPNDLPRTVYWCYLAPTGEDQFFTWNRYGTHRLQHWDTSGALIRITTIDHQHPLTRPAIIDGWDGTHYFGRQLRERLPDSFNPFDLISTDLEGTHIDTLWFFDNSRIPIACGMIEAETGLRIMSDPLITSDGRICVGAMYEDWVHVIDQESGRETLRFRWENVAAVIPDTLITHYRGQIASGQDMEAGARWLYENLSVVQLIEGVNGEIWVQRSPQVESDGTWIVDVFDRDGEYRGRLRVPDLPARMKPYGEHMYGIGLNGEAPALIRYRLISEVR
ncbi:hypothetical protein ACFL6R_00865 [Gemmatimonadota bacterium]